MILNISWCYSTSLIVKPSNKNQRLFPYPYIEKMAVILLNSAHYLYHCKTCFLTNMLKMYHIVVNPSLNKILNAKNLLPSDNSKIFECT